MRNDIRDFLKEPVPPSGTQEWQDWQTRCRALGEESIPAFLQALEDGTEIEQYAALLGLRLFGYEAYGQGYGRDLRYRVRAPEEAEAKIVKPKITPEP